MTSFWLFIILIVISSVVNRAMRGSQRGGPPPVARPMPPRDADEAPWMTPAPRPMTPASRPMTVAPRPMTVAPRPQGRPAANQTISRPSLPSAAPVSNQPLSRPLSDTRSPSDVDAETDRIAGEAEAVARAAESLASAGSVVSEAESLGAHAAGLGQLQRLELDITPAGAYALPGQSLPALSRLGVDNSTDVARAVVLAEVLGRPKAWQRHLPQGVRRR